MRGVVSFCFYRGSDIWVHLRRVKERLCKGRPLSLQRARQKPREEACLLSPGRAARPVWLRKDE